MIYGPTLLGARTLDSKNNQISKPAGPGWSSGAPRQGREGSRALHLAQSASPHSFFCRQKWQQMPAQPRRLQSVQTPLQGAMQTLTTTRCTGLLEDNRCAPHQPNHPCHEVTALCIFLSGGEYAFHLSLPLIRNVHTLSTHVSWHHAPATES